MKRALAAFYDAFCQRPDDDGCRLFTGPRHRNGYGYLPRALHAGRQVHAHRHVWWLQHGTWPAVMVCLCDHKHCMTVAHWRGFATKGEFNTWKKQAGRASRGRRHSLAITAARRAKATVGSIELAREIRALDATGQMQRKQIAALKGVSPWYVTLVCQQRIWREPTPFSL